MSYIEGSLWLKTKRTLKQFAIGSLLVIIIGTLLFSFAQKPFKNSTFELTSPSIILVLRERKYQFYCNLLLFT